MSLLIRQAARGEEQIVFDYICKLADYESLRHEVEATVDDIRESLFGVTPRAVCDLAFWNGEPAGFAFGFITIQPFAGGREFISKTFLWMMPCAARALAKRF